MSTIWVNKNYMNTTNTEIEWAGQSGFLKLQGFLNACVESEVSNTLISVPPEENYILKYSVRYGLIDSSLKITTRGRNLKDSPVDNRSGVITDILKSFRLGHSSWITHPSSFVKPDAGFFYYVFESYNESESGFDYSKFLSAMGIICDQIEWDKKGDGMIWCRLTDVGKAIAFTPIATNLPSQSDDQAVSYGTQINIDLSTKVDGNGNTVAGGIEASATNSIGGDEG